MAARSREARVVAGAFAVAGDRWTYSGDLRFDDAMPVLAAAAAFPLPATGVVEMSGLGHGDSSALAVLVALQRRAQAEGRRPLSFPGISPAMLALARVYGVESVLVA
ncbi:MAG: STAS domain-containing protein [Burkholderiales bacterium]|nr:STAS domain-containing protein [Burkholderiales bacterium]